ncbi:MAG: glycoside hydrolase family 43 protein [Akkermansiaceae bacterium]|nr:glycoside hydrolase family 43 protein [Akkermansiaceae bacterium]
MISNPILPGFHPDPSIVRVGDDYYLANSTFEWFPGVPIHHSRDLKHWRLIGHALNRTSQFDLRGVPDSGGVWAPSMSHADGRFWLVYTNLRNTGMGRPFKDIKIFLTTAENAEGPWSDPIELDSIGFDPSLFHDEDGRKWLVNMEWDFRKGRHRFAGIVAQEFDPDSGKLVGDRKTILQKTGILTEGPNLYRHDGWYYLMLAEGGTGWNHGISAARSRNLLGPYELDPQASVLTTRDDYGHPLQKSGHGEIVQTPAGEWFLAHLASRPVGFERRCTLGRETCLQRTRWTDGWLRLENGGHSPAVEMEEPTGFTPHPWPEPPARDEFDGATLDPSWQSLRVPADGNWVTLSERPGWLRLRGRESVHSFFEQSLLAKRLTAHRMTAETVVEFEPDHPTQMAGLVCWYNTAHHFYLRVTHEEDLGKVVGVTLTDKGAYDELGDISIDGWHQVHMRAFIDRDTLIFFVSPDGNDWVQVGPHLDFTKISDDYANGFTGAMIGIAAQDLANRRRTADFGFFELRAHA